MVSLSNGCTLINIWECREGCEADSWENGGVKRSSAWLDVSKVQVIPPSSQAVKCWQVSFTWTRGFLTEADSKLHFEWLPRVRKSTPRSSSVNRIQKCCLQLRRISTHSQKDGLICRVSIFRQDDHSSMTIERHIFPRKLKKIVSNSQFCNWSE